MAHDMNIESGDPDRATDVAGIVLAGVHAWDNCALERVLARPLLPVAGRPLAWHILEWLAGGGITRVVLCANSDTARVRSALGLAGPCGLRLDYYEDLMPRGPAGCARDAAATCPAQDYIVCDGSILPTLDLAALLVAHRNSGAALTVAATRSDCVADAELEPLGVYVCSRRALEQVPPCGFQDIKETLIPALAAAGASVQPFEATNQAARRIGGSTDYLAFSLRAIELMTAKDAPAGYSRRGQAWVHDSARVDGTARLIGPVWIGPRTTIEAGAIVVGPACLGGDNIVGRDAVVSCTVCWERCTIAAAAVVDHCVLAHDSHVQPRAGLRRCVCLPPDADHDSTPPATGQANSRSTYPLEDHRC